MRLSFVTENTVDVASDVNQSLLEADGLIVSRVTGIDTAPPAVLIDGLRVAIASGATGAFSGKAGQLGVYVENGAFWQFYYPALCVFDGVTYLSAGGDWIQSSGGASTTDPRFTDAREWTATTISQAEVEEGTATTRRAFTAQRVRQGITAWFTGISGVIGRTILGRSTAAEVRGDLGLGTAATKNAGTDDGDVLTVGARGLGIANYPQTSGFEGFKESFFSNTFTSGVSGTHFPSNWPTGFVWSNGANKLSATTSGLIMSNTGNRIGFFTGFGTTSSGLPPLMEIYHSGNTTKNPDGTLKASSPVINLYTDKHDLHNESQFGATPAVTRKSKGVYEITGTLGLRSEGWYLDTPSDRNGNKYFNIEWTQNITPDAADGVVDEYRDDIVVTIETFERVWNKDTGLFENGAPIDINDLQDRFVQLRFNEIKVEHEELDDETVTRNQE